MGKTNFEKWMPAKDYANLNRLRMEFETERNGKRSRKIMIGLFVFALLLFGSMTTILFNDNNYFSAVIGSFLVGYFFTILIWLCSNYGDLLRIEKEVEE